MLAQRSLVICILSAGDFFDPRLGESMAKLVVVVLLIIIIIIVIIVIIINSKTRRWHTCVIVTCRMTCDFTTDERYRQLSSLKL